MDNLLRTLVFGDEVSLTLIDGTNIVNRAIEYHKLNENAIQIFGKALLFTAFLSGALKEKTGEVSLLIKGDGELKSITVSGNYDLKVRGAIEIPEIKKPDMSAMVEKQGTITVIRDDGYSRPFMGTSLIVGNDPDQSFEEYFAESEQLPTFIRSRIKTENGKLKSAVIAVLQPLPFAKEENVVKCANMTLLDTLCDGIETNGVFETAKEVFSPITESIYTRGTVYKCNCSKEYLSRVLISLGKDELNSIIKDEGKISIHCHYCNKDYTFTADDVEKLF